jgi:hypothetical protein
MNTAEHNAHGSNAIQNSNELDEASRKSVGPPISTKKEVSEDALKKAVLEKTGLECTSLHKIAEGKSSCTYPIHILILFLPRRF